jgi:hypothetical protein
MLHTEAIKGEIFELLNTLMPVLLKSILLKGMILKVIFLSEIL